VDTTAVADTIFALTQEQGIDWLGWGTLVLTGFWLLLTYKLLDRNTESVKVAQKAIEQEREKTELSLYPELHFNVFIANSENRQFTELIGINTSDNPISDVEIRILGYEIKSDHLEDMTRFYYNRIPHPHIEDEVRESDVGGFVQTIQCAVFGRRRKFKTTLDFPYPPTKIYLLVQFKTLTNKNYVEQYHFVRTEVPPLNDGETDELAYILQKHNYEIKPTERIHISPQNEEFVTWGNNYKVQVRDVPTDFTFPDEIKERLNNSYSTGIFKLNRPGIPGFSSEMPLIWESLD
jgi:hypothetical protein